MGVLRGGVEASLAGVSRSIGLAVDFAYSVYGLDVLGVDVSEYLRRFQRVLEGDFRVWASFSVDVLKIDPDAVVLLYRLFSKYGFQFAERIRRIAEDVRMFQLPGGRIIMGDHFSLTRLLVAFEGEESEAAKLAVSHSERIASSVGGRTEDLVNVLLTLTATPGLSRRFRRVVEGFVERLVERQLPNGSWGNQVFLTCRAVRGIAASRLLIYRDNVEAGIRWLSDMREKGGLKPRDLGYLLATISEVRVGAYEVKFPAVIRDVDELYEFVSTMILMGGKSVLLLNIAAEPVFKAVRKALGKGVMVRVILGPEMEEYVERYGKLGIGAQRTGVRGIYMAIVDGEMIVMASDIGDGKLLGLAIKAPGLSDQLIAGLF